MRAFTMSLGEYDFSSFSDNFRGRTRMIFSMILLGGLIIFVSLTIYNLFIAVVISDVKDLQQDLFLQNIYNMGELSYLVEEIFPRCLSQRMKISSEVRLCVHDICGETGCGGLKLPEEMNHVKHLLIRKFVYRDTDGNESDSSSSSSMWLYCLIYLIIHSIVYHFIISIQNISSSVLFLLVNISSSARLAVYSCQTKPQVTVGLRSGCYTAQDIQTSE